MLVSTALATSCWYGLRMIFTSSLIAPDYIGKGAPEGTPLHFRVIMHFPCHCEKRSDEAIVMSYWQCIDCRATTAARNDSGKTLHVMVNRK
jgi:hypothetical protein